VNKLNFARGVGGAGVIGTFISEGCSPADVHFRHVCTFLKFEPCSFLKSYTGLEHYRATSREVYEFVIMNISLIIGTGSKNGVLGGDKIT